MVDLYTGLAKGPLGHASTSILDGRSEEAITMGDTGTLGSVGVDQLLPRILQSDINITTNVLYGVVVSGVVDGVFGSGATSVDDSDKATNGAGQGVTIVTQGRAKARVRGPMIVGDRLTWDATDKGVLVKATAINQPVIAMALHAYSSAVTLGMIVVDVQRESLRTAP